MEGKPLYPLLPGPSGPEGMPEANDSVALCKQADRQGKKDHGPVLPRCGQAPSSPFFMSQGVVIPRTEEKIPSLDQDEAATLSTPVCGHN